MINGVASETDYSYEAWPPGYQKEEHKGPQRVKKEVKTQVWNITN